MSTQSQIHANRANARLSTGPRTPEGKAHSAANATKHGLTGRFRVLDSENQQEFDELLSQYLDTFQPANTHESFLVEQMVQARWKLERANRLEALLIAQLTERRHEDDADSMLVNGYREHTLTALANIQRHAAALQRTAFRAQDQLLALRKHAAKAVQQNEPRLQPTTTPAPVYEPPNNSLAITSPIASDAVAAGLGAFNT